MIAKTQLKFFLGKTLKIVMPNGYVRIGEIKKLGSGSLIFEDPAKGTILITYDQIKEVSVYNISPKGEDQHEWDPNMEEDIGKKL